MKLLQQNPSTQFDPTKVYMIGYHPHGIISVGCFINFACEANLCGAVFPGIKMRQ